MTAAALLLTVLAVASAVASWVAPRFGGRPAAVALLVAAMVTALSVTALLVLAGPHRWGVTATALLLVLLAALAVAGGGPLAVVVLALADDRSLRSPRLPEPPPLPEAGEDGEVLRGGAWIGALERAGIFATLVAGWPEGVAVVLAVKGVGRYHELGAQGAAERFIIGTFASVLWAASCAGVWWFG